jgi:RNA polymerase sigma factor (sigma-70 family)
MKSSIAFTPTAAYDAAELVRRTRSGDASAWRDLVKEYEPLLRRIARRHRLSAEDADDAVQLTWLRYVEHIDQLTHPDRLRAWLVAICRRESIHLATRGRREVALSGPEVERLADQRGGEGDPFDEAVRHDEHDRLYSAIGALPQRQRALLVELLRQEGQSYLDLSHHLNLPVGSLGPTRQRALARLRNDPRLTDLSSENPGRRPGSRPGQARVRLHRAGPRSPEVSR